RERAGERTRPFPVFLDRGGGQGGGRRVGHRDHVLGELAPTLRRSELLGDVVGDVAGRGEERDLLDGAERLVQRRVTRRRVEEERVRRLVVRRLLHRTTVR